ncbi:hypothetical protein BASA81_002821 [Batrachochytrium salamandrivorans]|nr:hypothetical protein BASA81_002821 [Batrachochytrium salamandrivorans]
MDIDFVRRGPLSSLERENRMKQGLCLVCGEAGHRKANCPKSRFKFNSDSSRNIRAIQTEEINELATRLNIPLVKIPVPIKLRLADGDSSSMITHRTLPLQLHIGRHVETIGFYVTSLCHGIILGYSWLERHNPQVNWESRMVDFGSNYCLENCCVGSTRIQGLGKPPSTSDISPKPSIPEQESSNQASDSAVDPPVDASLFKDPSMDLDLGIKKPVLQVSKGASKSVSFAETIQAEVYPFLEASPVSTTPIPSEIDKEFSSVFSESQANILPSHRSFDCTINLSSSAEPSVRKDLPVDS